MRFPLAFAVVVLALTACSTLSDARESTESVENTQFRHYLRFAREMALRYFSDQERAVRVTKITKVRRKDNIASITFEAVDIMCKPGERYPIWLQCPALNNRVTHFCSGSMEFPRKLYGKVKYLTTICLSMEYPLRPQSNLGAPFVEASYEE
ncbi:uncharacterized protein LOC125946650 [Dermacentor silvarum]|uniref:uncharacterized protein LOC125946650 n=1 Tax=Dermacentor silvarum TaxID=543639 RepID=UPI0021009078|nr:uncharacterized protein LOC125946650 [Dermacentor silvarum]